jgi:hypothetical protein
MAIDAEAHLGELPDPVGLTAQDRLRLGIQHRELKAKLIVSGTSSAKAVGQPTT